MTSLATPNPYATPAQAGIQSRHIRDGAPTPATASHLDPGLRRGGVREYAR